MFVLNWTKLFFCFTVIYRFFFSLRFWRNSIYFDTFPDRHRVCIDILSWKTVRRAVFNTAIAYDTPEPVNLPCPHFHVYCDCLSRTWLFTFPAGNTFKRFNKDPAPECSGWFRRPDRIHKGCRFPADATKHHFCHWKESHSIHLSAQPIQGSIESTIIGTSASSQPFNIVTSGVIFASVGVLTLCLARNLVPFPLM